MAHHVVEDPERGNSSGGSGNRHLRARNCVHGYGRPAEFTKHLALEGGDEVELDPRDMGERRHKYGKGQHDSNV